MNLSAFFSLTPLSRIKYNLLGNKKTGCLILDRVLFTSTHYPQNYGFIPLTYARDNDPLDVLVLCSESIIPMSLVRCRPIGVLIMLDNGYPDEKIIAVAENDPFYNCYNDIKDVPSHILDEIKHFFSVYKELEGKSTVTDDFLDKNEAMRIIKESMDSYVEKIVPTLNYKRI